MKYNTVLGNVKETKFFGHALRRTILAFAVFLLGFILLPNIIAEASASTVTSAISWSPVSLTLDPDTEDTSTAIGQEGHGDVLFDFVAPTSVADNNIGTMQVIKKRVSVATSGQYFAIYLQTGGDSAALTRSGTGAININPINGTWEQPITFTGKSWGYAVPANSSFGSDLATAPSVSDYTVFDSILGQDLTYSSSQYYNHGKWAAVPNHTATAQQIWTATTVNPSGFGTYESGGSTITGDQNNYVDVYYAAIIDTDLVSGEYSNTLLYTAMARADALDQVSHNLVRDKEFGTGGDSISLAFDLASSAVSLAYTDVNVWLVPHLATEGDGTPGSGNNYTTTGLESYKTNAYKCTIASSANFTVYDNRVELTCTLPTNPGASANADGLRNTAGGASMAGEYDFWVEIPSYGYNYISKYTNSSNNEVGSFTYAGLQTRGRDANKQTSGYRITDMQQMTTSICTNTNKWSTGIGVNARVYDLNGSGTALASSAAASAAIGTGTFLLKDTRDNKTYLVRHLADGQCWMVQNLDLNLASFAGTHNLNKDNTNITMDYWDPSAKLRGRSSTLENTSYSTATYQFQSATAFGSNLLWGSICQENTGPLRQSGSTSTCTSISVANNNNAYYARSYNNDSATATSTGTGNGPAYIGGTQNIQNATTCATYSSSQTGGHQECHMPGAIDNVSSGTANNLLRDSSWNPGAITTTGGTNVNGSDTFTMRGSMYVGDYYNWYAATAETGNMSSTTTSQDICPKGWRLPVNDGSSDGSWTKLLRTTYGLTGSGYGNGASIGKVMQLPLSVPMTGNYDWTNGALYNRGYGGSFWSSTGTDTSGTAYYLNIRYGGGFSPQNSGNKVYGFTIRCVAK